MSHRPKQVPARGGRSGALALVFFLALLGLGGASWRALQAARTAAAESEARDIRDLARLQADNERLARMALAKEANRAEALGAEADSAPAANRVEVLHLLSDLVMQGYLATPAPGYLDSLVKAQRPANEAPPVAPPYMIDANGNPAPGFAEFFALSEAESQALQSGWSALKQELEAAIHAKTTVRREEDGSVVLQVRPIEGSASFRERYTRLFEETLGPLQYRAFKALNLKQQAEKTDLLPASLTSNANLFGEVEASYTLKRNGKSLSQTTTYKGNDVSGWSGGSGGMPLEGAELRDYLIKKQGPIMKLLPPDF